MSTPKRRFARSSATSTCIWLIPERISSPVCWSRRRRSVGSSSARRRIAGAALSSAPFDFGGVGEAQAQCRVLLGQTTDRGRDLLLVALRLRGDGEAHDRLGKPELG